MPNFILRSPLAILGALGFVSLLKGVMQLHEDVLYVVNGFQAVTHPIWDYTIGRFVELSSLWKSYLTMGLIVEGASLRAALAEIDKTVPLTIPFIPLDPIPARAANRLFTILSVVLSPLFVPIWPWTLAAACYRYFVAKRYPRGWPQFLSRISSQQSDMIFFEFLVWAALIIAFSYALIFADK
ncbi:MAG: hypothetical protein ABL908_20900 [Hyphomicrobium sp.]